MAMESVARRYARAAFELALDRGESLDSWLSDLRAIETALSDPAVAAVLAGPRLPFEQKRALVERALGRVDELRRNLVYMLIESGRIEALGAIVRELQRLVNEHNGVAEATITTAVPLSEAEAHRVAERVGRLLGKRVILERRVDPSIIGGIVVRVGDTLINGSIAGRLAALREQLV
ncbi:MAG TPA: ATP synthase F1 subunit delta [Chloroflexota bacterium]|jgi:F-type H+-transporting ATPase subunit delta